MLKLLARLLGEAVRDAFDPCKVVLTDGSGAASLSKSAIVVRPGGGECRGGRAVGRWLLPSIAAEALRAGRR